ncbi:RES family NAD+ phosphorylase [Caulobacter endophyticus]|uniref:RES family NAD+ phosphorylase n=1 Tax=Caulobacter endophyticus TaxID=2172652 RepID=UPI00240F6EE4|nr:RES family NAD+ phosphorylase [Caulobacter endophyticus]MDG2531359.1 RES family NAD+ phosphorylase [Caulobacter endophyticus]
MSGEPHAPAPRPAYRLIPSRFPPIGLFDTVATAADLDAVMDLAGWTNDRLVAERIARLPMEERVYGRPNASIVMASFLHVAPGGMRFNGPDLGAWYAAEHLTTAVAEVAHHLRREAVAIGAATISRQYRVYTARLKGDYLDIRGQQAARPEVYASDDYAAGQVLGEAVRASGGAGILFDSLRHAGGVNVAAHRPRYVQDVTQGDHYELRVQAASRRIEARRLAA